MMLDCSHAFLISSLVSSRDFHNGNGRFKSKKIRLPNFLDHEIALKSVECMEGDVRTSELKWNILACNEIK